MILAVSALIFASCNPYGKPFDGSSESNLTGTECNSALSHSALPKFNSTAQIDGADSGGNCDLIGRTTKKDRQSCNVAALGEPLLIGAPKKRDLTASPESGGGSTATGSTIGVKKQDRSKFERLADSGGSAVLTSGKKSDFYLFRVSEDLSKPQNFGNHG